VFGITEEGVRVLREARRDLEGLWQGVEALEP
jgi:hypothetical protein